MTGVQTCALPIYAPAEFKGAPGPHVVGAMVPGHPETQQTYQVVLGGDGAPQAVNFEFATPVPDAPPPAPDGATHGSGRKKR